MGSAAGGEEALPAAAIARLMHELETAQRDKSFSSCQQILTDILSGFDADHEALDRSLFDVFGTVVSCVSCQCFNLVQQYLVLVADHCSGREVMTVLMSRIDATAGCAQV